MKHDIKWSFLIHLSTHMWEDSSYESHRWYATPFDENNNVNVQVWDTMVKFLAERHFNLLLIDLGDAVKYETHPEISAPDAWDKDFLKKKLDEARALGITPIPKLNFSCAHHTWLKQYNRMVSSPIYYQVCADLIREVCELFDYPEFFHIGFDEEEAISQNTVEKVVVRGQKLWWHDLFFLAGECEKHGARAWMWSDYFWEPEHQDIFLKNMPKSILQSNWFYNTFKDWTISTGSSKKNATFIQTYEILDEKGYDQIPTASTWQWPWNIRQTCGFCKERLNPDHLLGIMVAPWVFTTDADQFQLMSDAHRLYMGRQEFFPETLK